MGAQSRTRYAYYYPDKHPSLFVSFLGAGHQGTAILVRSTVNHKLYVRKRTRPSIHHAAAKVSNETTNTIAHPHIPRLISQTPYRQRSLFLPEPLIWRLMHHILTTMLYLHTKNIAHGDLIIDNIFVHWPVGTTDWPAEPTSPPDFLIGDFGCSYTLPPDHAAKRQHRVTDTHQAIHKDLASVSECVDIAMAGPWHDVDETAQAIRAKARYSGALLRASETLAQLPGLLQRFKVSRTEDGEMFDRVVKPLKLEIECALKEAERMGPKPDYTRVRPRSRELNRGAFSYETSEDLLACSFRPPGPWCIAEVDLDGRLKEVDLGRRFCEEEAMVTLGGIEMEGGQVWEEWPEACG